MIEDYGKASFEEKKEELFEMVNIPAWFTMDTRFEIMSAQLDIFCLLTGIVGGTLYASVTEFSLEEYGPTSDKGGGGAEISKQTHRIQHVIVSLHLASHTTQLFIGFYQMA